MTPEEYYHLIAAEVDYTQPVGQVVDLFGDAWNDLTVRRRARLAYDYDSGMFYAQIAKREGISAGRTRQIVEHFWMDVSDALRAACRRLFPEHTTQWHCLWPLATIADRLWIHREIHDHGILLDPIIVYKRSRKTRRGSRYSSAPQALKAADVFSQLGPALR